MDLSNKTIKIKNDKKLTTCQLLTLSKHFKISKVAEMLDVSLTTMKRYCRLLGITKWCYRQYQCKRYDNNTFIFEFNQKNFNYIYNSLNLDSNDDIYKFIES